MRAGSIVGILLAVGCSATFGPSASPVAAELDVCDLLREADIEAVYEGGDAIVTDDPPPGGCLWVLHGGMAYPLLTPAQITIGVFDGNQMNCGGQEPLDGPWDVGCSLYEHLQFFVRGRTVKLGAPPRDPFAGNVEGVALAKLVAARLP